MGLPRIYFVSDLHLGDGTAADRFLHPGPLLDLLDRVAADPDGELVLLGDVLELWACDLDAVATRHAPLLRRILDLARERPVTYVVGNHDCLPFYLYLGARAGRLAVAERYVRRLGADLLVALHGHQYDPFNRVEVQAGQVHAPWTQRLVRLLGDLQRAGLGDLVTQGGAAADQWLQAIDQAVQQAGPVERHLLQVVRDVLLREPPGQREYPLGEERYRAAALDWMRQGARWVVMGHTHHPDLLTMGRRVYANTGCWCWDRYPPTYALWVGGELNLYDARTGAPYRPNR